MITHCLISWNREGHFVEFLLQMAVALNGVSTTGELDSEKTVDASLSSVVVQK
jgi:hypothetical protein